MSVSLPMFPLSPSGESYTMRRGISCVPHLIFLGRSKEGEFLDWTFCRLVEGNETRIRKFSIKSRGKKTLRNSRFRWKDNINIDFMEVLCEETGFS